MIDKKTLGLAVAISAGFLFAFFSFHLVLSWSVASS